MGIAIVALPEEGDKTYKVSTEQKPHMTLMYLGDGPLVNEQMVVQYIEHITKTSLRRFYMTVERRGILGSEGADVLFFEKAWMDKDLRNIRAYLLADPNINQAYNQAKQYETWTPHLTLGYPDRPAKDEDLEYPIYGVQFDRIAIWLDDYDGPEFVLPSQEVILEDSAYHSRVLQGFNLDKPLSELDKTSLRSLAHFGVKGMKWGVRKDEPASEPILTKTFKNGDSVSVYPKTPSRLDKFLSLVDEDQRVFHLKDKDGTRVGEASFAHEGTDALYLQWLGIKKEHRGKGYASAAMDGAIKYARDNGLTKLKLDVPGKALDAQHIYSKRGFKVTATYPMNIGYGMELDLTDLSHAANEDADLWAIEYATQFADLISEGLSMVDIASEVKHYGIPGMKWGRRRARGTDGLVEKSGSSDSSRDASEDHIKARSLQSKPLRSLSNKELKDLNQRLQLERSYSELTMNREVVNQGRNRVQDIMNTANTLRGVYDFARSPFVKDVAKLFK